MIVNHSKRVNGWTGHEVRRVTSYRMGAQRSNVRFYYLFINRFTYSLVHLLICFLIDAHICLFIYLLMT